MQHKSTAPYDTADKLVADRLESLDLGDPTESLRRRAFGDLFLVAFGYVAILLVALAFDLGDAFHHFVVENETWEVDEFILAGILTLVAFAGFSLRQWIRYSSEIRRRLKLEKDLAEMRVLADQFGENKAVFLSNLAHDLRTPLNGIIGFAQLLEDEPYGPLGNEQYKTYIATIRKSAVMLGERITTCLDPGKIDFGAEPLQMMPFPLQKAVMNAMPVIRTMAKSANITVACHIPDNLPYIHGDVRALKKIVTILATNAITHCQPNGKIRLSAAITNGDSLTLTLEDDGVSMDATLIAALKRTDSRAEDANTAANAHMESLILAKKLLDMHGASLAFENRLGNGTVATATFPKKQLVQTA